MTFAHFVSIIHLYIVPSPPSDVTVSQNGVGSVQVSWTLPSGEPAVIGYIIYYQQQDGGHNGSQMAGATATNAYGGWKVPKLLIISLSSNLYVMW